MPRYVDQPSAGSRRLLNLLGERTQTEVAETLEVTQSCVSLWASGKRRPMGERRSLLEERLGIPRGAWDEPPTMAAVAPCAPSPSLANAA
jgi:hypothetical protein